MDSVAELLERAKELAKASKYARFHSCGCSYDSRTYETIDYCDEHKREFPLATA